jgi:hypothetical protein
MAMIDEEHLELRGLTRVRDVQLALYKGQVLDGVARASWPTLVEQST